MHGRDREIVRRWANDRTTRRNSFRQGLITKKDHARWFQSILDRPDENKAYLCWGPDQRRVGIVRFSRIQRGGTGWEVHFTVCPRMRGKGLAGPMIQKALRKMRGILPRAAFVARVKRGNHKSLRVLKTLGFQAAVGKSTARGLVLTLRGLLPAATKDSKPKGGGRKSGYRCG